MKASPRKSIRSVLAALLMTAVLAGLACGASARPADTTATKSEYPSTPMATQSPAPAAAPAVASIATPAPAVAPTIVPHVAPRPAKVTRLIFGSSPVSFETNRIWAGAPGSLPDAFVESLLDLDPKSGAVTSRLADRWEFSPDGKSWTFFLHRGVPFHFNFGEFTTRDVVHTHSLITYPDSITRDVGFWRESERLEAVNDYQLVFHMKNPAVAMPQMASRYSDLRIFSKAQWDREGMEGIDRRPAGTGSYQYVERRLGQSISFERVENHWRGEKPAFKELEIRYVPEDGTRLAMLLTKEAHLASLPRELQREALKKGMKVITSQLPAATALVAFGGQYHIKGDPSFNPQVPWNDKRVRQAMNLAVNRKELLDVIFDGRGTFLPVQSLLPSGGGWNPEWEKNFDELYGYNPAKAKLLLDQVGYAPGTIKVKGALFALEAVPEMPQVMEALQVYFHKIGIQMELEQIDPGRFREMRKKKEVHFFLYPGAPPFGPIEARLSVWNTRKGLFHSFEDDFVEEKFLALTKAVDPKERDRWAREIGDHLFESFSSIPLYSLFLEVVVNPKVVAEWTFPGTAHGRWSHWPLLKEVN